MTNSKQFNWTKILLVSFLTIFSAMVISTNTAQAAAETVPNYGALYTTDGIANSGYDVVAYFSLEEGAPAIKGSNEFSTDYEGVTYHFANKENKELFMANPKTYTPEYGGYCAYAVSKGGKAPVDPNAWAIVDGKLYLNFDDRIQKIWVRDISGYIAKADKNWPTLKNE